MPSITFKLPGGKKPDVSDTPTDTEVLTFNSTKDEWDSQAGGGGGEDNTSSNVGSGDGLAKAKVGVDLPFKSIITEKGIRGTSNTNDLTIDLENIISIIAAASDETTVLSTGTAKTTFRMPYAFTLSAVRASLSTAGTGAALVTVDINEGGSTILSTKITIDASEKTSTTAATAPVISDSALADDAEMTVDIDTIDTDNVAKGLKIYLIGKPA